MRKQIIQAQNQMIADNTTAPQMNSQSAHRPDLSPNQQNQHSHSQAQPQFSQFTNAAKVLHTQKSSEFGSTKMMLPSSHVTRQSQNGASTVSPIMSSSKISQVQRSYNSVNISSEGHPTGGANAKFNNENGVSQNQTGSASNTPNHLSQQNLIKIMKKIKSSASNVSTSVTNNKENQSKAPPNIMIGQPRPVCLDSLHPSGSTTPTGADQQIILQAQKDNLFSKGNYNSAGIAHNPHTSSGQSLMQKKIISIAKLSSNNAVRSSKDSSAGGGSQQMAGSQSNSATNQSQKIINLNQVAQHLQAHKQIKSHNSSLAQNSCQAQGQNKIDQNQAQLRQMNQGNNNCIQQNQIQRQEVSPVHIHYHNKNIIQVSLNVSPTNAQQVKVTASSGDLMRRCGVSTSQQSNPLNATQNNLQGATVTVSSVFMGDNQRKKSVGDKPLNQPITSNFPRKSSLPQKQNVTIHNVSPMPSHRGGSANTYQSNPGPQQKTRASQDSSKFDLQFAQQIHQKLQMQQQQQIATQQQSITLEDSIDNTQAPKEGAAQQQKINFYPQDPNQIHNEVSFSQTAASEVITQSNQKQNILSQVSKYIKLKSNEINVELTDDQLENLKEFLTYLEKKNIINVAQLEHDQTQLNSLIQDIMKLDLTKFSQQSKEMQEAQESLFANQQNRSGSNPSSQFNQQRGSVSSNKTSRRQGTPVSQIALTGNSHQSDSTLSSSISNFSNFQKRRSSIICSGDNSPNQLKLRTNSQQSNQSQGYNHLPQGIINGPQINVQVHGKVNNLNIQPINIIGSGNNAVFGSNGVQSSTSSQNKQPLSLNEQPITMISQNVAASQAQQVKQTGPQLLMQDYDHGSKRVTQQQNPVVIVGGRRGSDGQIIQRNIAKLSNQSAAVTKKVQLSSHGSGSDSIVMPQPGIPQRRVGSAEQKRSDNSKMKIELQSKPMNHSQLGQGQGPKVLKDLEEMSTQEGTGGGGHSSSASINLNTEIMQDREKLIKYNKAFIKKNKKIPTTTLDFYKFVKLIGKGAFGKVTLGIHKLTGKHVAIKAIDKNYMKDDFSKKKVFQEVFILKKIRHSNIIRLLEVFESPKHFLMVMEYAGGGDLLQFVKQRKRLEELDAKYIFKQIVYGLGHCHCRSVLHRDIKLDNILMDLEGSIKICDFGVSRIINKGQMIQEQCGTPAYLAPEIIADEGYEGFYVDIWSLGVLLYAMLQGTVPFKASNLQDLHALILQGNFQYPVPISEEARDLIQKMLMLVPHQRISIPEILNHAWMKGALDPDGIEGTEEDDDHDFRMGLSFQRQECNLNPLLNPNGQSQAANGQQNNQEQGPLYQGNINSVLIDNLFYDGQVTCKLSYMNYCALTQDYYTHRIDEEAIRILENFGYPRQMVIESLNRGDLNHATASYNLLVLP